MADNLDPNTAYCSDCLRSTGVKIPLQTLEVSIVSLPNTDRIRVKNTFDSDVRGSQPIYTANYGDNNCQCVVVAVCNT